MITKEEIKKVVARKIDEACTELLQTTGATSGDIEPLNSRLMEKTEILLVNILYYFVTGNKGTTSVPKTKDEMISVLKEVNSDWQELALKRNDILKEIASVYDEEDIAMDDMVHKINDILNEHGYNIG